MDTRLEIKDYSLTLGNFHALDHISLQVPAGKTLALIGESGSGKTLTALSVMGMLRKKDVSQVSGEIIFNDGEESISLLSQNETTWRKLRGNRMAMIFQEPLSALNPSLTCGYQLTESMDPNKPGLRKDNQKKAEQLLEEVELKETSHILNSYPHQLSGGQRQRLMIAMALARNPSLLVADEPTTALDVTVQHAVLGLLKKLQEERNLSILFISHDLNLVRRFAHQLAVMHKGKIVEQGNAEDIFSAPQHIYTQALLACRPSLHYASERLPMASDFYTLDEAGNFLPAKIKAQSAAQTENRIPNSNVPVFQCRALTTVYQDVQLGIFSMKRRNKIITSDINLEIAEGETLAVIGESGSGKTTLARTLLRLQIPQQGEVLYNGKNLQLLHRRDLLDCQMVYQDPYASLNPSIKIGSQLAEVLKRRHPKLSDKAAKEKITEILHEVGMDPAAMEKYPHQFSGGQRQRISIARALALEPRFLVLDEPVAALDISLQAQVLNLLKSLRAKHGLTYFVITHDLNVARFMADKVMVLKKGSIAEYGTVEKVFSQPASAYTVELLASSNL